MFARTDVPSGLAVDKSAGRLLSAVAASTYGRYEVSLMLVVKDIVPTHPNELLKIVGLYIQLVLTYAGRPYCSAAAARINPNNDSLKRGQCLLILQE